MPEFDNPGHTRALGFDPEFREITRCFDSYRQPYTVPGAYKIKGTTSGVMDPSYSKTFDLIKGILTDINNMFPDNMVFLGGDEVNTNCYNENPNMNNFMKQNNLNNY